MRVYIASLSDYNDGRLEGKWFDLSDYSDASDLMSDISDMLNDLTDKYDDGEVREEWAVHDYEDIPPTLASEYMGEADFQQLLDIREVAEENNIPVEVLVERAGDTGSDDYQALAESLVMVVDGNDETDIVYELESQMGDLGSEFWAGWLYIDDVTERVLYSEDVDEFRYRILDENPDMDENEAERQAEEMADEQAENRKDVTSYLEDLGYSGDEIPSWVSKDYESAWKRSLTYDYDVIHHDGEMYVFSNNYALGGTILSGMVGAYIGYKYAESKRTGKKLFAKGGGVSKFPVAIERRINEINELLPKVNDADEIAGGYFGSTHYTYVQLTKPIEIKGKYVYIHSANGRYDMTFEKRYNVNKLGDEFDGRKALNYDLSKILKAFKSVLKDKYEKGGGISDDVKVFSVEKMRNDPTLKRKMAMGFYIPIFNSGEKTAFGFIETPKSVIEEGKAMNNVKAVKYKNGKIKLVFGQNHYSEGGGIGFKGLSNKVAKRYEGKKVAPKYQDEYGKRYSKSEAKEVGDKVAGKVYWQQRGRKFENGGKIQMGGIYRVDGKDYLFTSQKQNYEGDYTIWEAYKVVYDEFNGEKHINYSKTKTPHNLKMFPNNVKAENVSVDYFAEGGGVDSITPALNQKVTKRALEIYSLNGGKTQSDFEEAQNKAIIEFGYNPQQYHKVMREIGSEDDDDYFAQGGGVSGLDDLIRG